MSGLEIWLAVSLILNGVLIAFILGARAGRRLGQPISDLAKQFEINAAVLRERARVMDQEREEI